MPIPSQQAQDHQSPSPSEKPAADHSFPLGYMRNELPPASYTRPHEYLIMALVHLVYAGGIAFTMFFVTWVCFSHGSIPEVGLLLLIGLAYVFLNYIVASSCNIREYSAALRLDKVYRSQVIKTHDQQDNEPR